MIEQKLVKISSVDLFQSLISYTENFDLCTVTTSFEELVLGISPTYGHIVVANITSSTFSTFEPRRLVSTNNRRAFQCSLKLSRPIEFGDWPQTSYAGRCHTRSIS